MKNSLLLFLLIFLAAVRVSAQCTFTVSLSSSSPNICSGSSVVLTATPSGGGTAPFSYAWSTGETTSSISVNKAGTYSVTVTDKTPGCTGIKKSIPLGSGVAPMPPTVASVSACPNSPVTLTATAPGGTYQWYDAATGGNFLATGASYTTPPITAATTYYIETTVNGCTSSRAAVVVTLISNPTAIGASICAGNTAILQASHADSYTWYDAAAGGNVVGTGPSFVTPVLFASTTYYLQGTTNGCASPLIPVPVSVTPSPAQPTVAGPTAICSGANVTLHATGAGTIDWFSTQTGGTSLISSPDFTTPPLTTTTTYYVQSTVNTCTSGRTPFTITVNAPPSAPVVATPQPTCLGSTVTLTPTGPGGTYEWYNAQNGGTLLFTGPSFTSPPLNGSTVYYVQADNGCISNRIAIAVTVLPILASPSASGAIICSGSTATLTATQPGGTYEWFDASAGGTLLFTGASFTTPALTATTTYYVQSTIGSCVSGRTPVTVTVQPPPTQPTVPAMAVCPGSVATLNVTSPSGDYAWYDASTGGTQLTTGPVYVTPVLNATTIYYVEAINSGGCASNRTPVTVTVNTIPGAPTATGPASICPGNPATLTATATGTVNWYSAATGGTLLGTGNTFTTPPLSAATTYYLDQTVNGCTSSSRGSVTVAVTPVANPQFLYPSATFCASGPNPTPMLNNPAGGTFSSSPVGLVFVSTTTGQINIAASSLGTYTVTYNGNGACPFTTNTTITVTNTPSAQFTYATPYCQDQVSAAPVFPAGASAGFFTVSPSGLTFPDPTTGKFNPSQATAGTYTITNTIPASGACPMATFSTTVTIDANVVVNAGPDQTVPAGTPVTLAGSVTNGATTGTWSGGTGSFSNPGALNATYTPGAGETSATLTLTSADPPGACGPKTDQVTITFIPTPNAPAAAGTSTCSGSVATLTATAPGGTYEWYTAFTGGTLLSTGPTFVTPALTTNTTYYVQTTTAGGTSPRTPVAVTINPVPVAPFVPPGSSACYGSATTLTATGSAGGYEWYDSQTGGNLLSTGSTYTTTVLTVNTSYYVQSVVNGCSSSRIKVDVTVNPVPGITSARLINICSGTANNYTITATVPGTTFTWSRAAVIGISNPAVTNQTSSTITETLINTTHTLVNAIYTIIPSVNGCTGAPFRFIVTVNPPPSVSSPATVSVCSGTPLAYNITFDNPNGVTFTWSRAAVPGISNAPLTAQASSAIQESLVNTTNAPVDVTYVINYQSPTTCPTPPFNLVVTVYPHATLSSPSSGVACTGVAQNYSITSDAAGASFTWSRAAVPGISNTAVTNQTTASITEALDNTTTSPVIVTYIIIPSVNGCPGEAFAYKLTVYPAVVTPEANANSPVCTGSDINLQTAVVPGATYNWTGPNNFTSAQQNPTINNATSANAGTYTLYITMNGTCNSLPATVDVAVNPQPVVTVQPVPVQCTNVASVPISGTSSTKTGAWSTNGTGTFGNPPNVLNNTYLPSAQDIASGSVVLTLTSTSPDNCAAATMPVTITFKSPIITSGPSDAVCSGTALNYAITSDVATATFTWSRAAVAGISNLPVSNQTSGTITETLINTTNSPIQVLYIITPLNAGCPGAPFTYTVTVNPIPQVPKPAANSPVCVGTDINLQAPTAAGATYSWTGPNGFTSPLQNPVISGAAAANAGNYSLTITVNGCQSPAGIVTVVVDPLPTVDVGPNQTVTICPSTTSVQLAGSKGGSATGGTWTTSGSGTFTGGGSSTTVLNGQYFPSAQDVSNGSVTLTLASTSNDNCAIATATLIIKIQLLQAVTAGPDQTICSEDNASLAGQITIPGGGIWTTSGTGKFSPSASQLNASYVPSAQDIKNGSAVLTLTANNAGTCYIPTDKLTVTFAPPPTVSAGPTRYVLKGQTITLEPTVSDPGVSYSWSPNIDISDVTVKNPVVTGNVDETYTLTVTDSRGCTATSSVKVIVSPTIVIPNAFTPNGDGVNDEWNIVGLQAYQQCTVDIYDRNGQKVFHSVGYGVPWDGTYAGKQVPYGAYYYIINPNFSGLHVLSGNVTVIR